MSRRAPHAGTTPRSVPQGKSFSKQLSTEEASPRAVMRKNREKKKEKKNSEKKKAKKKGESKTRIAPSPACILPYCVAIRTVHPCRFVQRQKLANWVAKKGEGGEHIYTHVVALLLVSHFEWGHLTGPSRVKRLPNVRNVHAVRTRAHSYNVGAAPPTGRPPPPWDTKKRRRARGRSAQGDAKLTSM